MGSDRMSKKFQVKEVVIDEKVMQKRWKRLLTI